MKTSLPFIARPADRRDYYEPATVCRLNPQGADATASSRLIPPLTLLAGA